MLLALLKKDWTGFIFNHVQTVIIRLLLDYKCNCSSFRSLVKLFILRFFSLINSQSITAEPHFKQVVIKDQAASLILVSRWGSNVIWKYFVFLLSNFGENGKELPSVEISNLLHLNPQLNTLVQSAIYLNYDTRLGLSPGSSSSTITLTTPQVTANRSAELLFTENKL